MAKSITVYTSIIGDYDNLRPPAGPAAGDPRADFVCFADEPIPTPAPWRLQPAPEPYPGDTARNSRMAKILSHLFVTTEYSIWLDGNLELLARPSALIDRWLKDADLAVLRHHYAHFDDQGFDCIYKEAETCIKRRMPEAEAIRRQAAAYRADGHPVHGGLYVGGFILRRHTPAIRRLNEAWWHEIVTRSARDQISLPYVLQKCGVPVSVIEGSIYGNPLVGYHMHAGYESHVDNEPFTEQRKRSAARRLRLSILCEARKP